MNRQCLWFVVKEGVCRERGTDIHDEVVYGTVAGVHDVGLVLHISPQSVYKMNTPVKEVLEECLPDAAPVVAHQVQFLIRGTITETGQGGSYSPW